MKDVGYIICSNFSVYVNLDSSRFYIHDRDVSWEWVLQCRRLMRPMTGLPFISIDLWRSWRWKLTKTSTRTARSPPRISNTGNESNQRKGSNSSEANVSNEAGRNDTIRLIRGDVNNTSPNSTKVKCFTSCAPCPQNSGGNCYSSQQSPRRRTTQTFTNLLLHRRDPVEIHPRGSSHS